MEFAAGVPSRWVVTLHSGAVIEVAADAYRETDGHLTFNVLVDATAEEQDQMLIDWRVPRNPGRVGVVVARIPARDVASLFTAPSWFDDGGDTAGSD